MAEASGAAPGAEQDPENDEGGGMDSEGGESSDLELDDSSISGQLAIFLRTSGFDEKLFAFLHAEADALEIADEGEEQKIEVHEAYLRFTQLFDGEFSDFMAQTGCGSLDEMFERLDAEDKADKRAQAFFRGLLAGMEYSSFITLVRNFQEADDDVDEEDEDADCDDDDDADQAEDTS